MHIFVRYIHTLINGNPQGAMLAIQNIVLGQLALQIYNLNYLIKYIFQTIPLLLENFIIITYITSYSYIQYLYRPSFYHSKIKICQENDIYSLYQIIFAQTKPTSFPGLQCEDEARHEEALVWVGHVLPTKWQYLTATRQGVARYSLMKFIQVFETNK